MAGDLAVAQIEFRMQAGALRAGLVQLPSGSQRRLVGVVAVHAAAVALRSDRGGCCAADVLH
jgi:hypothetical protein